MNRFVEAFRAQWRAILADKAAMALLFGGFVIYSFLFPLPYRAEVAKGNPVAVVDLDQSSLSRQLIHTIQASGAVTVTHELHDLEAAFALLRAGAIRGYLVIPADFRRDVISRRGTTVAWGGDAVYLSVYNQVATAFAGATGSLAAAINFKQALATGKGVAAARASLTPVTYASRPLFNTREGTASASVPAVMVLVMQQTILMAIGLLAGTARERSRFLATPDGGWGLSGLLGLAFPFVIIYTVQAVYFYGFVNWFWDLPTYGRLVPTLFFMQPFFLACTFFGAALGNLFSRREAALVAFGMLGLPIAYVAGFAWPHEALVWPLRAASWLIPSTAGIQGSLQLMQMGATFVEVLPRWIALWGLVLLYAYPAYRALMPLHHGFSTEATNEHQLPRY